MKKSVSFLALLCILTLFLCSCGTKELTSDNVKSVMADILPGAANVYRNILYGGYKAVVYDESDVKTMNDCSYAPVSDDNFNTIDKIKAEAEKYYTEQYAKDNLYSVFEGDYPIYAEFDGKLYVNIDGGGDGGYTFSTDSATLESSDNGKYVVSVQCLDNYETKYTAKITFVTENGQLKISLAEYNDI